MQNFFEFIDKKDREGKRHLQIVKKLLENHGFKIKDFLDDDEEPYIFVANPGKRVSFDGVRIYKLGDQMAFRVQKEARTHPYGKAYRLDLEDMFNDLLSGQIDEKKAGHKVVKSVVDDLTKFFKDTRSAEHDLMSGDMDDTDALGQVLVKSTGMDYANMITNKT